MRRLAMRDAVAADLPTIVALIAEDQLSGVRDDPSLPLAAGYLAALAAIDADPEQRLVVAELDGRVVGTLQLSFLPGLAFRGAWRAQIEAVRIAGELRGQGLGGEMIGWAVEQARARGCRTMQLTSRHTRIAARRFYERLGFAASHIGMKLQLGDPGLSGGVSTFPTSGG